MNKCPFFVVEDFISPLECEEIIDRADLITPDLNPAGKPVKTLRYNKLMEQRIVTRLNELIPDLEQYYGFECEGTLPFTIEWYPQSCIQEAPICGNSEKIRMKWTRVNDTDFTGIIFLKDYYDKRDLDDSFEVYGGKLEFPTHQFGFNPARGLTVIFPAQQNFIHHTVSPSFGDAVQIRFNLVATEPYVYDMTKFPGDFRSWFR